MFASVAAHAKLVYKRSYRSRILCHHRHKQQQQNCHHRCFQSSISSSHFSSSSSYSTWTPAISVAATVAAVALLAKDQLETVDRSINNSSTQCDFMFLPSFVRRDSPELQQKQASRKRNYTMALIESFSAANDGKRNSSSPETQALALESSSSSTVTRQTTTSNKQFLTVDSKYKIDWQKSLGVGAFGGVFEGVHRTTGKHVAIKQIPKQCTEYATFQREWTPWRA